MRPKYATRGIVLARHPMGEASASVAFLTAEFGLMRTRVQGIRKPGAKLAPALQTLSECDAILVRGKDGWRLSGAILVENWFRTLTPSARERAGRIASLIQRLVHGESADHAVFAAFSEFLAALPLLTDEAQEAAEILAALRIVRALGLDAGMLPGESYDEATLAKLHEDRRNAVLRINNGIRASGL